ncbi:MAG: DUF2281 domain-containing protein [Goleter apudmare HA4340-LM2]|jgi:hypothetical protein|nr:DUF2281 domain-containing protein [Goleter apudmare HA4340-LM2]
MQNTANIEQIILENLRQLPLEKQQEVLDFTEFLRQKLVSKIIKSQLSLREIAAMPLAERHQYLAQFIPQTADDFLTNPELTEFSVLDTEDWELEHD